MPDALLLAAALVCSVLGMGGLALAMDVHWQQVRAGRQRSRRTAVVLRVLGAAALVASLALCLWADTATMAVLVWMMLSAVAAVTIALCIPVILTSRLRRPRGHPG